MQNMTKRKKSWGFDTRDIDTRVRPQNDFFHFAGGGWMKRNTIPSHESRWGTFLILRHKVDRQLHNLVKEIEHVKKPTHGSPEQMLRDFMLSGLNTKRRRAQGLSPLSKHFTLIDSIGRVEDIVPTIAKLENIGGSGVWGLTVDQDMKDSELYRLYLGQGGLGMPDRDYYLDNDAESRRVRTAYCAHLARLSTLAKLSGDPSAIADRVLAVETKLAHISMKKEDLRDVDKTYFRYTLPKLAKLTPNIDWTTYMRLIGASVDEVIVMQPDFFKAVSTLLRLISLDDWKLYLRIHLINDFASLLTPAFEKASFAFYGTVLTGVTKMKPAWRRTLAAVNGNLGELLGRLYVERHFSAKAKAMMHEMVSDLLTAYEARIKNLNWMSPSTKKKALTKLREVTPKIGYPKKWKDYKGIHIDPADYVGNMIRAGAWHNAYELRKLRKKKVDRTEWHMYPQTVNAYYNYGMNDIVFPAGILQPPFFSPDADAAINYGAIGSVIGHEITHGFDDQGSKFDGVGNRKTWWTQRDRASFEKKAEVLVTQFNEYKVADSLRVNGQLTLGENIADLGGISIAYDAYQHKLERDGRTDLNGFSPEQRFFLGASLFERELSRPEFTKMQVTTDPHSPAIYRVNGPLSNLPEFYAAFGVTPGDNLYRAPQHRAKIW